MDDKIKYVFKNDYTCSMGKINEGREITYFNGIIYLDGIIVPEPYATDIKKMFENKDFLKNYIIEKKIIKNKI